MKNPLTLAIWSVFIFGLAGWNIWSWHSDIGPDKDWFTFAVGVFCALVGVYTLVMSLKSLGRKGN